MASENTRTTPFPERGQSTPSPIEWPFRDSAVFDRPPAPPVRGAAASEPAAAPQPTRVDTEPFSQPAARRAPGAPTPRPPSPHARSAEHPPAMRAVAQPAAPGGPAPLPQPAAAPEMALPGPSPVPAVDAAPVHAHPFARIFSAVALGGVVLLGGSLARSGYYIATDSFVAPLILSSDSDLVLPSKLNLARIEAERATLDNRRIQAGEGARAAADGIGKLNELKGAVSKGLRWSHTVTSEAVRTSAHDLAALDAQQRLLRSRVDQKRALIAELEQQLATGLVRRADLERERDGLRELQVAALQIDRERAESSSENRKSNLAKRALNARSADLDTPEMAQQRDQLIRIDVDIMKLEAERAAQAADQRHAQLEIEKLDALLAEVKSRPVFRAIASQQNVAFVPYTQLDSAVPGAVMYECSVWGMFACREVGVLTELLPGEVVTQDPWGSVARGQYALLRLDDADAARAKVLRARTSTTRLGAAALGTLTP